MQKNKKTKKNEVEFQNIRFPKRHCYIIWLFSAPRPGVTGFTCGRGSTLTGAVRAWGRLTAGVAPGAGKRRRRGAGARSTKMWEVEASPSKLPGFFFLFFFISSPIFFASLDVNCDVYQEVGTGTGTQLVYPRVTPMLKREHPVPEILIALLASPNCGAPLC